MKPLFILMVMVSLGPVEWRGGMAAPTGSAGTSAAEDIIKGCGQKRRGDMPESRGDVVFVFNAGSMSSQDMGKVKEFISHLVRHFNMATGNIRVGLVSKSSQGEDINLKQYIREQDFISALMNQPRPRFVPLLKKVRLQSFDPLNGRRHNAKKRVIVFMDDSMEDSNDALYEALLLKNENALIYVAAVGTRVAVEEMKQLATTPAFIKTFDSYTDLVGNARKGKEFLDKFCESL